MSHGSSDIIHTEQDESSPKTGNGSRRSTITFLLKSHNNKALPENDDSSTIQNGAKIQNNVGNGNILHVCQQHHNGKSPLLTSANEIEADKEEEIVGPKLTGNGNYDDCRESADM